jgi:hypothetical protein
VYLEHETILFEAGGKVAAVYLGHCIPCCRVIIRRFDRSRHGR